jgi:hypothetical protein
MKPLRGTPHDVTLIDRYVWTVTRHLPTDTGPDVAAELRGTIEEMVEDIVQAGTERAEAETTALTQLGDPDTLARQYGGGAGFLIGPGIYSEYVRLLKVMSATVLPIAFVATFLTASFTADENWAQSLLESSLLLLNVGIQLVFWITVTFVLVDRNRPEAERARPLSPWRVERLPSDGPWRQVKAVDFGLAVSFLVLAIVLVTWQLNGVRHGGPGVQVLNPALWVGWDIIIVGLLIAELLLRCAVWRAGRWTATLAAVNVLDNVGVVAVGLWLVHKEQLVVPELPQRFADVFGGSADWTVSSPLLATIVVLFPVWDSVDTVRKARMTRLAPTARLVRSGATPRVRG